MAPDEILVSVRVPRWEPGVWRYRKVGTRRANALTKASFAGFADVDDGVIAKVCIAFGAVGPTVVRARSAEEVLAGVEVSRIDDSISDLLSLCAKAVAPIDDQRSTARQ